LKIFMEAAGRRLWRLESEALCAEARRRTRLYNFDDPPIEPVLSILADSLEREAGLHPLGRFLMRAHLRGLLEGRLRLAEIWGRQSEALSASVIQGPVFITGMPRSGSTFLHELLAEDPANRAPQVWEVMFPVPDLRAKPGRCDPRIRRAAACLWWFRQFAPRADSVHPIRARSPQECSAIQSHTFLSEEFVTTCRIPGYEAFLHSTDLAPAYAWQRRFLQYLQLDAPTKRWVLKSPDHVYGLEELFSIFPDAVIIQTHRNPVEVLRSSCQLVEVLQRLFAPPVDRDQIAAHEARMLSQAMERFIRFRDDHPELANRFIDVTYSELVADPLGVVRRLYQHLQVPLTEVATDRMRRLISNRSRYGRRYPIPTLAELGLDVLAEARRFEHYCARFGVSCQPASPH
jgi:hypothetical protein